jgi:Flp pilus assembly secretin CpaC
MFTTLLYIQETFSADKNDQDKNFINIVVGETKIIKLQKTTDRIDLDKRGIIDVFLSDETTLAIKGISSGFTSVLIRYSDGKLGEYKVNVTAQTPEFVNRLAEQLKDTLKNVKGISINSAGSNIVISGNIDNEDDYKYYKRVISMYSDVVMDMVKSSVKLVEKPVVQPVAAAVLAPDMVQIDVQVVQIVKQNDTNLGVKWFSQGAWQVGVTPSTASYTKTRTTGSQKSNVGTNNFSKSRVVTDENDSENGNTWNDKTTTTSGNTGTISKTVPDTLSKAMTYAIGLQAQNINFEINALIESGKARYLATPKLVVQSGKSAKFNVGGEIPIAQSTGFVSSVDWKEYGTTLEVSPNVLNGESIFINLNAEVSELDWYNKVGGYPAIVKRAAQTNLTAKDNEMFAIAGLVSYESTDKIDKVPLLGDIPLVGLLFKSKGKKYVAIETIFFFTPHLVKENADNGAKGIIPSSNMVEEIAYIETRVEEVQEQK